MSSVEEISEKIKKMSLSDLLRMTASAIDSKMDEKRLDFIIVHLEMALQKRKLIKQFGLNDE